MIKKNIFQQDIKERFKSAARDRIHRFLMADDHIKGSIVHATTMIQEMQANHELNPLETLILGQAYIAGSLMCAPLKGQDRLSLAVECSGPVKGLHVDASTRGEIRGYLQNGHIRIENPRKINRLSELYGAGFLTVTKYLGNPQKSYTGKIMLENGNLAEDIANYYLTSEQISTAINLSVFFDEKEQMTGAGGLFLQALPGANEKQVSTAQTMLSTIDSLGRRFAENTSAQDLIHKTFSSLHPRFLDSSRVEFFCRCSHKKMAMYLQNLPIKERKNMIATERFPLELRCHHCNSVYKIDKDELQRGLS